MAAIDIAGLQFSSAMPTQVNTTGDTFTSPFPTGYSERNLALGVCGILINAITFPLVASTHKVNNGIKALILNMIINDTIFMSSLCVYGTQESSRISDSKECWVVIFLLLYSLTESYMLVLQAAFVNFLAIYKPIRFRAASKTKTIILCIVAGWVYCASVVLLCVGFDFPKKRACVPLGTIPRAGVSGLALTTVLCFSAVLALNSTSIVLTRRQLKMRGRIGILPHTVMTVKRHVNKASSEMQDVKPSTSNVAVNFEMSSSSRRASTVPNKNSTSSQPRAFRVILADSCPVDVLSNVESSPFQKSEEFDRRNRQFLAPARQSQNTGVQAKRKVKVHPFVVKSQTSDSNGPTCSTDDDGPFQTTNSSSSDRRKGIFFKVEVILIILTTWSCFLSLPFILYMVWLAAVVKEREKFAMQSLGVMCSSLILINCLTNPFFYAWRFIEWRVIYLKVRGLFRVINIG